MEQPVKGFNLTLVFTLNGVVWIYVSLENNLVIKQKL